jgi:hypothetical protein
MPCVFFFLKSPRTSQLKINTAHFNTIHAEGGPARADATPDIGGAEHRPSQVQGLRPRRPPNRTSRLEGLLCHVTRFTFFMIFFNTA